MTRTRPRTVLSVALTGVAATSLVLASTAGAQPLPTGAVNVVSGPQGSATGYLTPQVVSTAGTVVQFVNGDTTTHDVTSRATKTVVVKKRKRQVPIFSAPITASGGMSAIPATAELKAGTYDFYCSLHPGMKGVLTVQ